MTTETYESWQRDRQHHLDALAERLPPDLAVLLPRITEVAQTAVDDSLRSDGTLCHPEAVGERIAHAVGPVLEHGPEGGWCVRCGTSATVKHDLCQPCRQDLEQDDA